MQNKLFALYAANKGRGQGLSVRAEGEAMRFDLYDVVVSSKADEDWLGGVSAQSFVEALAGAGGRDVALHINSPGGDVFGGIAWAEAIRSYTGKVTAYVDGYAASAASLIAVAADDVVMAPSAMMMIHKAWTLAMGNADDMMAVAGLLEKIDDQIAEAYREKAGDRDWEEYMRAETWFTADEAIEAGLADRISERAVKAQAFDLSAYDNAPANVSEGLSENERRRLLDKLRLHEAAAAPTAQSRTGPMVGA